MVFYRFGPRGKCWWEMEQGRWTRAKLNAGASLLRQLVTLICGLIVPSLMINSFGSEIYGTTASISQFLAYITLVEGGIGGVARAALYDPLARDDMQEVSAIMEQIKRFFRVVAYIFTVYVLGLACSFKFLADVQALDWFNTFLLVIVISVSTFAQYYIGVANSTLLQAAQKMYIVQLIAIAGTVLNTGLIMLLVRLNCSIVFVKFASSCVFVLKPIVLWLYVRQNFALVPGPKAEKDHLKQRWNALGQHIAWFLHSNTDIAILTIFANLKLVAVYSVYNMVVSSIQAIAVSFTNGAEALFGDMLANKEEKQLQDAFDYYEMLVSIIAIILLATTAILIVPFVRLYTHGVEDQNYIEPVFALLLILSSGIYCLRTPYHSVVIAAGHFKQTQFAAYGEALINVGLSLGLVSKYGLVGVAIGTVFSTLFRLVFYVIYLSKNILNRRVRVFLKRQLVNAIAFLGSYMLGCAAICNISCENYLQWAVCGIVAVATSVMVIGIMNLMFYRNNTTNLIKRIKEK